MPTRAARSSTINIQGAMEKAEEARGESRQTSGDCEAKAGARPTYARVQETLWHAAVFYG
jgi:hypothetical protein